MDIPERLYKIFGAVLMLLGILAIIYYLLFPPPLDNLYVLTAKYVIPLALIYFGSYIARGKDIPPISK